MGLPRPVRVRPVRVHGRSKRPLSWVFTQLETVWDLDALMLPVIPGRVQIIVIRSRRKAKL